MQISHLSSVNYQTNFKSAVPVFVHVIPKGKTVAEAIPITTGEMVRGYMQQLTLYLNNSLKRGKNLKRDAKIDNIRGNFGRTIKDFYGKVGAFTCVDGGIKGNKLNPLFYYTSGKTKSAIEVLEKKYAEVKKFSQGYSTAEIERMNQLYPLQGKNIINNGYKELQQSNGSPISFHVYFRDEYTKTGNLKEHIIENWEFKPSDVTNPSIILTK